jgi:superfamily II DNA or RNA helicase
MGERIMKKVRIVIGPIKSEILPGKHPVSKILELCCYKPSWAIFSPKVQQGTWDGKIRLASFRQNGSIIFPTGLIRLVVKFLKDNGFKPVYKSQWPELLPNAKVNKGRKIRKLDGIDNRYYQSKAVTLGFRNVRGTIKMPTGSGKTIVAALLIKSIRKNTIFMTHKLDILTQTYSKFCEYFGKENVGLVGNGKCNWNHITCCMVQTLHRNWKKHRDQLNKCRILLVDEVHLATSPSWYNLTQKIPAIWRFGLTATPLIDNRKKLLEAATGPIIYNAKSNRLIKEGYLSKPIIFMVKVSKPIVPGHFDYADAYKTGIIENKIRHRKTVKIVTALSKIKKFLPIVIQTKRLEHLTALETLINKLNLRSTILSGINKSEQRRVVFDLLEKRAIDVIVVSTIMDEGVDVRNIRTLIPAAGGTSNEKTLQRLGRGMRTADGKSSIILIDFYDRTHEYLQRHSIKRKRTYEREGYQVEIVSLKLLKKRLKEIGK